MDDRRKKGVTMVEQVRRPGVASSVVEVHEGRLTIGEGEQLRVTLEIVSDALRVSAGGASIGAWPLAYCRVAKAGKVYHISIDGEQTTFIPDDPEAFARAAATQFRASSLADRIAVVKTLPPVAEPDVPPPPVEPAPDPVTPQTSIRTRLTRTAIGVVSATVVMAVVFALTRLDLSPPVSTLPPATIPPPPTAAPDMSVFDMTPNEFVRTWNLAAAGLEVNASLQGPPDLATVDQRLSESDAISIATDVGADGTVDAVNVWLYGGDPANAQRALEVWAVAMVTTAPNLSPGERSNILDGLEIDRRTMTPRRNEEDLTYGGLVYTVTKAFDTLRLEIRPEG